MKTLKNIFLIVTALFLFISCNEHKDGHKCKHKTEHKAKFASNNNINKVDKEHNRQDIIDIEELRVSALLKNDIETLIKIMHPSAIHISSNGTRKTTLEWLKGRENTSQSFATFTLNKDALVRFYDNIAIVDGSYSNSKLIDSIESPLKHARYTRVYKKTKSKNWQLISHQATETAQ